MKTSKFEDFKINVKLKLAALWTSVMFCYVYGDYFELYTPDKVAGFLNGDTILNSPSKLLLASLVLVLPSLMIALSLFLKPTINRALNIIVGTLFTLMMLLIAFSTSPGWYNFYIVLAIIESIITIVIVWQAWKWPKV